MRKNANDHESELCAYIRRHSPKIVVAKASAPFGAVLAKTSSKDEFGFCKNRGRIC